ncbi:MAG: ABC transporter ATP-binding protein [Solirubrobacteraceae bacterium]
MVTAAVTVESLTKRFGQTTAVEGLSFEVHEGKVVGFLGPNGAGKTTTLRALLGLVAPTSGHALVDGRPYRELADPARAVGAVLENARFHPGRSARNHLRVLALAARVPNARADEVLALVGLEGDADRRVGGYSLGMRQRLSLAAALLGDPRVLVLDEPANGLDPQGIRWLRDVLRSLAAEGRAVLVSSHVLAEIAQTVDDVVVIGRGRLLAQAPVGELTQRTSAGVRVRAPDPAKLAAALRAEDVRLEQGQDGAFLARGIAPERIGELAAANGVVLHELTTLASTLEDVFLELTGDASLASPAAPGVPPGVPSAPAGDQWRSS